VSKVRVLNSISYEAREQSLITNDITTGHHELEEGGSESVAQKKILKIMRAKIA
jgi:hypothetical protein